MQNKIVAILILISITFGANAKGYRISVHWEGLSDTTIRLARHYDGGIFKTDSLLLDNKGKGVFSKDTLFQEGLYKLHFNNDIHFDLLIGADQQFSVEAKTENIASTVKIEGADESEAFQNYHNQLIESNTIKTELISSYKKTDDELIKKALSTKIDSLDEKMIAYLETEIERYPGSMYQVFLKQTYQLKMPKPDFDRTNPKYDSLMYMFQNKFQRDNWFYGIDFTDPRNLYSPIFKGKLETYLQKVLVHPDTIAKYGLMLVIQAKPNERMFQYMTSFMLNYAATSKYMGMDALFVAIADNVYLTGQATWADSTLVRKIAEQSYLKRQNRIGMKAADLQMETNEGEIVSLHEIIADYTILVFWAPNCGYCKKEIPKLYDDVYMKYIDHNIEIFSVYVEDDKKEWDEFIEEHELAGWIHVWDPNHLSNFHVKYDVQQKPLIYLLDKNKKILAKKIGNETLDQILKASIKEK